MDELPLQGPFEEWVLKALESQVIGSSALKGQPTQKLCSSGGRAVLQQGTTYRAQQAGGWQCTSSSS